MAIDRAAVYACFLGLFFFLSTSASAQVCTGDFDCGGGEYCEKAIGDCGGTGTCQPMGTDCAAIWLPVCGCDGVTYSNVGCAAIAGINVAYSGECAPPGPTEWTVCPSGCDHTSIQAAIDASASGGTVLVHDGTYVENIDFNGKPITVYSMNGAASTTIDGGDAGSVATFNSGEGADSVLDGFTVTGGTGTLKAGTSTTYQGGGIYVAGSSPTIRNCTVTLNSAVRGGGVYLIASSSSVEDSTIFDNTGSGIYGESSSVTVTGCLIDSNSSTVFPNRGGGIYGSDLSLALSGTTLSGNSAVAEGGGLYISGPSVSILDSTLSGNSAPGDGGGLWVSTPLLDIDGTTFSGNHTDDKGGGAYIEDSTGTVDNSLFDVNTATGALGYGGGLFIDGGIVGVSGCTVTGNSADSGGGGVYSTGGETTISLTVISGNNASTGGGVQDFGNTALTIGDTVIESNTAATRGGGLSINSNTTRVERTRVLGNAAPQGGGMYFTGNIVSNDSEVVNVLVAGNVADEGGGVYIELFADILFTNVTIAGNRAVDTGGMHLWAAYATTVNTLIWGNEGTSNGLQVALTGHAAVGWSSLAMDYSVLQGGDPGNGGAPWSGSGNGVADPLFVNARPPSEAPTTGGNYRVLHGSSCRSAGTGDTASYPSLPAEDIGGASRHGGAGYEIGAYEWRAKGDWDADDLPDILWSDYSGGLNYLWYMNGAAFSGGASLPSVVPSSWTAKAVADFNGDGSPDILWRNYGTGEVCIWYMDGETFSSSAGLPTIVNTLWTIEAADDFDGDGDPDILWRYGGTGTHYLWLLDWGAPAGGVFMGRVSLAWRVGGTGDFDGDGDRDILWRNSGTGENYLWFLDGTAVVGGAAVQTAANLDWTIAGTADFDDNGDPDILWRNTVTGQNYLWYMDGPSVVGGSTIPGVSTLWHPLL